MLMLKCKLFVGKNICTVRACFLHRFVARQIAGGLCVSMCVCLEGSGLKTCTRVPEDTEF